MNTDEFFFNLKVKLKMSVDVWDGTNHESFVRTVKNLAKLLMSA
jgi:hypothetical protein